MQRHAAYTYSWKKHAHSQYSTILYCTWSVVLRPLYLSFGQTSPKWPCLESIGPLFSLFLKKTGPCPALLDRVNARYDLFRFFRHRGTLGGNHAIDCAWWYPWSIKWYYKSMSCVILFIFWLSKWIYKKNVNGICITFSRRQLSNQLFLSWSVSKPYISPGELSCNVPIGSWCAAFPFSSHNCL